MALADLRRFLDNHPEVWERVGNLALHAEQAWIALSAGEDHLVGESIQRQTLQMKADLCGPHPTATERLLVDQVVAAWLALKYAEMASARPGSSSLGQAGLRLKRVEVSQKRYLAALKMLTQVRALLR